MEGNEASALIASRMGIEQKDVESRLVALHQKGKLDGTANGQTDRRPTDRPMPDADDEENGDVSLTSKDLEEFEKSGGNNMTPAPTPLKLTLKPDVLGAPKSLALAAAPLASAAPPALAAAAPPASAAPSASTGRQAGSGRSEVAMDRTGDATKKGSTSDLALLPFS
jgi:hypothetical protein